MEENKFKYLAINTTEKRFEEDIETAFLNESHFKKISDSDFDKEKMVFSGTFIEFIKSSQPNEWARYVKYYGSNAEDKIIRRFNDAIEMNGLINVLKNGVKDMGILIRFMFFKPDSPLNERLNDLYSKNIFGVTRQFHYSTKCNNSIDMVLSINGIPLFAIELKNQLKNQTYEDAIEQWKENRDSKEHIFKINTRFLAYFAMDLYECWMTTELKGNSTYFLPFNQGSEGAGVAGGAGNPEKPNGYTVSYFWERVFTKDSMLDLIYRFISVVETKEEKWINGEKKTKITRKVIFPRFHQYDVVHKILDSVVSIGSGHNYLIEHSAGSGKSNSIAWIAYRLASAFDKKEKPIFDSVIIVTNRIVLDSQLQDTIQSFDHKAGLVQAITTKQGSAGLKDAINDKKKIIICTIQKFLYAYQDFDEFKDRNFAIIIDEAHQGQSGESARTLRKALINKNVELQKYADELGKDISELDESDEMIQEIIAQGHHDNQSFFAFTATPIQKTLSLFGEETEDGKHVPFHVYSMRQAIEEGYILDVLKDYMTIRQAFMLVNDSSDNPELLEGKTKKTLISYYKSHEHTIAEKVEVIMQNFISNGRRKINGHGKAMVIADSRQNAVKYYLAINDYIKKHPSECVGCKALVAFSSEVTFDNEPNKKYIEAEMNVGVDGKPINSDKKFRAAFKTDDFNIMVVADKYQTGYDEPLLHSMYIDKKLKNVNAVQTISRLNRTCPGKVDTFVLDFVNTADAIKESFQNFYEETVLLGDLKLNKVYDLLTSLKNYSLFKDSEVDDFVNIMQKQGGKGKQTPTTLGALTSILKNPVDRYIQLKEDDRLKARDLMLKFVKAYGFITQIVRIDDQELFKDYLFVSYLTHLLPKTKVNIIDLTGKIKLQYSKLTEEFHGAIELDKRTGEFTTGKSKPVTPITKKVDTLNRIIDKVNDEYSGSFTEGDRVAINSVYSMLMKDAKVKKHLADFAKTNDAQMFIKSIFPKEFQRVLAECVKMNDDAYQRLLGNALFQQSVMDIMAKELYKELKKKDE